MGEVWRMSQIIHWVISDEWYLSPMTWSGHEGRVLSRLQWPEGVIPDTWDLPPITPAGLSETCPFLSNKPAGLSEVWDPHPQ